MRLIRCGEHRILRGQQPRPAEHRRRLRVLLLNPDTEVYEGTLDAALARLESDPTIGMVGVKLVTCESGSSTTPASAPFRRRSAPRPLHRVGRGEGARSSLSQYRATHLGDDEAGEVDAVNGAFMLVRAEAVREVGLLDEGYWLYMEDLDWCRRFWERRLEGLLRARRGRAPRQGRLERQAAAAAAAGDRLPPRHGPLLPPLRGPRQTGALNLAVYTGIGRSSALSLAITAASRARGQSA